MAVSKANRLDLSGKVNYYQMSNADDCRDGYSIGLYNDGSAGYVMFNCGWIAIEIRTRNTHILDMRVHYGSTGWGAWYPAAGP